MDQNSQDLANRMSKRKLYVVISVLLVSAAIVGVFLVLTFQSEPNEEETAQVLPTEIDCSLSGQKEVQEDELSTLPEGEGFDPEDHSKIIARLLKKDPLVIEVLDRDPWANFVRDSLGVTDELSVREDALDELRELRFGDIFEARQYSYLVGGFELGIGSGIYALQKLEGEPSYYHEDLSNFPSFSRSGVLIRYHTFDRGTVVLYKDGTVYYQDKDGNVLNEESLSAAEMNELLTVFGEADFDTLPSDNSFAQYKPAVTLICNRYQNVLLEGSEERLQPVTSKIDKIVNDLEKNFEFVLKYEKKKDVEIIEWPLPETPLSKIKEYHDEALALYRSTGKVQEGHPAYTRIPAGIVDLVPSGLNFPGFLREFPYPLFMSDGRLFAVSKGFGCVQTAEVCKNGTLYTLNVAEITVPQESLKDLNAWPSASDIMLSAIPEEGLKVSQETYERNKGTLDLISGSFLPKKNFFEGKILYEGVHLVKVVPEDQKSSEEKKPYLLKTYSKNAIFNWETSKPLSSFAGMHTTYLEGDRPDDEKFIELKQIIPAQIESLVREEAEIYFIDGGVYYKMNSLYSPIRSEHVTIFVSPLSESRDNYFTGYLVWDDREVSLASIPRDGVKVSERLVTDNKLKLQFREDKYYIEGGYIYILELSNEPD